MFLLQCHVSTAHIHTQPPAGQWPSCAVHMPHSLRRGWWHDVLLQHMLVCDVNHLWSTGTSSFFWLQCNEPQPLWQGGHSVRLTLLTQQSVLGYYYPHSYRYWLDWYGWWVTALSGEEPVTVTRGVMTVILWDISIHTFDHARGRWANRNSKYTCAGSCGGHCMCWKHHAGAQQCHHMCNSM